MTVGTKNGVTPIKNVRLRDYHHEINMKKKIHTREQVIQILRTMPSSSVNTTLEGEELKTEGN